MKKILTIALVAMSLFATSCKEWLDINDNPNYLPTLEPYAMLSAAQVAMASKVGYNMELIGTLWSQHAVQGSSTNQYNDIYQYDLQYTSSYFSDVWTTFYSMVIPTFNEIIEGSKDDASLIDFEFMGRTLRAYCFYILNSLYGDVAYTEGCQRTTIDQPHFDAEKDVYNKLVAEMESILAMDKEAVLTAFAGDVYYQYDMIFNCDGDLWYEFANSLYIDMLLRDFDNNKSKIQAALANPILSDDAKLDHFEDTADRSNPFYESDRRQLNTTENLRCCKDVLDVMSADDARVDMFYTTKRNGAYVGGAYGTSITTNASSKLNLAATDPVYFFSAAQAEFNAAEIYARLNDAVNAQAHYEAGVEYAFDRFGLDASDLLEGDYAFKAGGKEAMVKQIIMQKWLASIRCNAWSAWFDINRTGYPERGKDISKFDGSIGGFPHRYLYPQRSSLYNANTPDVVPMDTPLWWQK